jgi:uncharacterized protein YfkK (UPF0435 family)
VTKEVTEQVTKQVTEQVTVNVTAETTRKERSDTARDMLADGEPIEKIVKYSRLSLEEIQAIADELNRSK